MTSDDAASSEGPPSDVPVCTSRDTRYEAEELLRALGGPLLEWREAFNGVLLSNTIVDHTNGEQAEYEVVPNHRGTRFYGRCVRRNMVCSRSHGFVASEDDAKALCERHLMTGEWE